jgi:hypothetical protein
MFLTLPNRDLFPIQLSSHPEAVLLLPFSENNFVLFFSQAQLQTFCWINLKCCIKFRFPQLQFSHTFSNINPYKLRNTGDPRFFSSARRIEYSAGAKWFCQKMHPNQVRTKQSTLVDPAPPTRAYQQAPIPGKEQAPTHHRNGLMQFSWFNSIPSLFNSSRFRDLHPG